MPRRKELYSAWAGILELRTEVDDIDAEEQEPHEPMVTKFLAAARQFKREFEKANPGYKVEFEGRGTSYGRNR
jgi:hypothetical protein